MQSFCCSHCEHTCVGCPHHHWRCKLPLTVARTHEKILNLQHIGLPRQPETDSRVSEEIHLVEQYQEQVSDLKKSSLILDEMFIIIHSWGVWYSHQLFHSWYSQIALWYGSYIEEIGCQSPFQIRRLSTLHSREMIKLLKLNFSTFDSNLLHWLTLWKQYCVAIHDQADLSQVQKLSICGSHWKMSLQRMSLRAG